MNVLITGASSGIGKATAEYFSKNGDIVYAIDIKPMENAENIRSFVCDITSESSLLSVKETLKSENIKLDAIINIAGMFFMDNFLEITEERLKKIFDVNLLGTIRVNKTFFELLNKKGKIIVTTSEVGALDPLPFNSIYGTTKVALDAYAHALRHEAGLLGIKVITVRPGAVNTPLAKGSITSMQQMADKSKYFGGQAERFEQIMRKFTGKMLKPEKLAKKMYKISHKKHTKIIYSVHTNLGLKLLNILPKRMQVSIIKKLINKK